VRRFASPTAASYCGIDLHARTMYLVVLDHAGDVRLRKNLPARPDAFLAAVAPFRPDLVVAGECVHTWYWLADACAAARRLERERAMYEEAEMYEEPAGEEPADEALRALGEELARLVGQADRLARRIDALAAGTTTAAE
jgi:hypothetical protein